METFILLQIGRHPFKPTINSKSASTYAYFRQPSPWPRLVNQGTRYNVPSGGSKGIALPN